MIEHRHRFHGHGSIRQVYRRGQVVRSRFLSLRYEPNAVRLHSRCSVVVSKKIFKAAVKRNLIRRRIYEQVRLLWPQLDGSYDIILTVFDAQIIAMPPAELGVLVKQLLIQARVIKASK